MPDKDRNEQAHRWPYFLPDGEHVLFATQHRGIRTDDADIEVVSLKTGKRKVIHRGGTYPRSSPTATSPSSAREHSSRLPSISRALN